MTPDPVRTRHHRYKSKGPARGRRTGQSAHTPLPGSSHVTRTSENLFADLGFAPEDAANLRIRAVLMTELRRVCAGMPQREAAALLGVTQPRVSHLARGRIDLFTIDTLVNMLAHAGARIRVSVSNRHPRSSE